MTEIGRRGGQIGGKRRFTSYVAWHRGTARVETVARGMDLPKVWSIGDKPRLHSSCPGPGGAPTPGRHFVELEAIDYPQSKYGTSGVIGEHTSELQSRQYLVC